MSFKIFNFIYYMTMSAKSFFNIFFRELGYTSSQIGLINSIARGIALFILPFWGMISDRLQANKKVLQTAVVGTMIISLLFLTTTNYYIIILFMVLLAIFMNPIRPLYDNLLFSHLENESNKYGRFRLWGALGSAIAASLLGYFLENTTISNVFYVMGFLLFITLLTTLKLPKNKEKITLSHEQKRFANINKLFKNKLFIAFLIYVFFMQITMNGNLTYFSIYILEHGGKEGLFGLTKMIGSISEIFILIFSDKILNKFSTKNIFAISSAAFVLRWLLLALFPVKVIFLSSQILHSLSFGLFYVTCVNFINEITEVDVKATAQNVFTSVYIGLGSIVGNTIGGAIFDSLGGNIMYFLWTIIALSAGIGYFLFLNINEKKLV